MIKYANKKTIDVSDWDDLVRETYGRTYSFQQQDDCKERQQVHIFVPVKDPEDFENTTVPEIVNSEKMGVSFKAWLERDPEQKLSNKEDQDSWSLGLWWDRNFYPHIDMIINDLHSKGLIEEGDYTIEIDW
jgi:hypothetical protein